MTMAITDQKISDTIPYTCSVVTATRCGSDGLKTVCSVYSGLVPMSPNTTPSAPSSSAPRATLWLIRLPALAFLPCQRLALTLVPETLGGRFARLWAASTLSALGTGLTTVAAPLYVSARTSSALVVSATTGVALLPWLLFALPAGVLVDRADRRRLMITLDWVRAALLILLAVAIVSGWSGIVLLDVVLFLVNTGEAAFEPASPSVLPAVVRREQLERANGWLMGGETLARYMLAGPFGGFLYVAAASVPFFTDAGTYAASAVLLGLVGGSFRAPP